MECLTTLILHRRLISDLLKRGKADLLMVRLADKSFAQNRIIEGELLVHECLKRVILTKLSVGLLAVRIAEIVRARPLRTPTSQMALLKHRWLCINESLV